MSGRTQILAYIKWTHLPEALALGWLPCASLPRHHGHWSLLCEWRCECGRAPKMPRGRG
jgi:hypothetical protein